MKDTPNTNPTVDVIISGAGPVGLFLACELALAKCSVLVLEKAESAESPLKQMPFGIRGLNAPTIESLDRRGLFSQLDIHKRLKNPHLTTATRRQAGHFAGIPFYDDSIDTARWTTRLASSTPPSIISEMEELEKVLTARAETLGVDIRRGCGVTGFNQTSDVVTVQAGDQTFTAQWLVGCDGSRSVVRKAGGFEFAGTEPEFTGYTTKVDIADPEKLRLGRNLMPRGMYLQSQPGYVIIQDFDGGKFHDSHEPITLEYIQQLLRQISETDVTITALHTATTWTDRSRQATAYRKGRVLLAGDAAHIHSPLGGQGLNLGLGDAMNLGWKLAATIHGHAPDGLLDSYHNERHPLGVQVLDWSRAQVAIMRPGPTARALNAIVRDLIDTQDGATYFAGKVWGISIQYDLGAGHPLVGRSVPNFELQDGTTVAALLRGGKALLLDFTSSPALASLAGRFSNQMTYVSGQAKEKSGLQAILIRPDGVVAWGAESQVDVEGLEAAALRWFMFVTPHPRPSPRRRREQIHH